MSILEKPKSRGKTAKSSRGATPKEFSTAVTHLVEQFLLKILEDSYKRLSHYRHADYSRDVATLRRRYASEGLGFATKTLPDLFMSLLSYLETGQPSYPSFKTVRGGKHPVFLRQLFAMVVECHDERACIDSMQCLYQLCHAFKKLRGPYKPSTLQHQLWSFVEEDIELRYLDFFSEPCFPILKKARDLVTKLFKGMDPEYDVEKFIPRPGPGATNTPRRKNVRYRPHVLYEQLNDVFPYEDWFYSHPWDVVTGSLRFKALERKEAPSSRFKFVPKTFGKPRGICIEELETQFIQQAIKGAMYNNLQTHPLTRGFINFDDQSINGELAKSASGDRKYATLDMSSASDRVSRTLVRYLFHGCPEMREALMAVSTKIINLGDGDIEFPTELPCEKFAPMGSAVCFPTMALVHFVLIKAILACSALPHKSTHEVYVYGDDIIVRTECVQAVYDYLPLFGMKFNTEKSYRNSWFRESCGVHAYKGVEITPAYFKYVPQENSARDIVLSLLSLESQLFNKGFYETARFLRSEIHKVKSCKGYSFPYTTPKSPALGFIREDVDAPLFRANGLKRRWNSELQCHEVKAIVARPLQDKLTIAHDNEAYLRAFCDNGPNPVRGEENYNRRSAGASKSRAVSSITARNQTDPFNGAGGQTGVMNETLSCAQWLKDLPGEPPRFIWTWLAESSL